MLVALTVSFGLLANHGIAGGSDSYGYVSQADLWLHGHLQIAQPEARHLPWPGAQWTLSPLGYRPSVDQTSIVPVYAPGLPIMMAAFTGLAGQCASAWVVPLCGGLLVVATFGIGRRMFSEEVGAGGAFLVATSPVLLSMIAQPMSDVPAAAFWALAACGCLLDSRKGDLAAGLSAAVAILIRPNLAHVGVLLVLWVLARELARGRLRSQPGRSVIVVLPVAIAGGCVALLYRHLYGSATTSGYGPLIGIYSLSSGPANLVRYGWWLIQSQTPVALAGLLALFVPLRALRTMQREPVPGRALLAFICLGVIGGYLFWEVFDAWWYLRFLLPAWPAICLSAAWLLAWPTGRRFGKPAIAALVCIGVYGVWFSYRAGAFNFGEGERRYAVVGRLVRDATPPNSIVFSMQHSGSVRYYGGRMSLRYDWLNERWLDRAVAWFDLHGVHPYFLLDEGEIREFHERFESQNTLGHLNVALVWEYYGSTHVFLYDPLAPQRPGERVLTFTPADVKMPHCPEPASPPQLVLKE